MSNKNGFFSFKWLKRKKRRPKVHFEDMTEEEEINEVQCRVYDVYVDIPKEIMLHYKHCDTHGYTIPVDLKTLLYKSTIFFHPNIWPDFAPSCILHNAEVPGSEKNRIDNGRMTIPGRRCIDEIPAIAIHKFRLAEQTRADGADEVKHRGALASTSSGLYHNHHDRIRRGSFVNNIISRRHSDHDRPTILLPTSRRNEQRQKKLTSKSVVFVTPDEENKNKH